MDNQGGVGVNLDNIPFELQQLPYWCVYGVPGLERKCPANPKTLQGRKKGGAADYTTAWCRVAFGQAEGVGFDFTGNGFVGIDLDHVRDVTTGEILPWARAILDAFSDTYIEYSLSMAGFHIIAKGSIPKSFKNHKIDPSNKNVGLEMMGPTGFIALTGNVYNAAPVVDCSDRVLELWEKYSKKQLNVTTELPPARSLLTDEQVIEKASKHKNFEKLYAGAWEELGCYPSQSEADQALCNLLAFWCGRDTEQMNRLFISSGLFREKWEGREDYRANTIENAVRGCSAIYDPTSEEYRHRQAVKDFADIVDVMPKETLINPLSDKERYSFNDRGNGFLFADLTTNLLRYCPQAKGWYVYRAGKWAPDIGDATAREFAKKMSNYLFRFISEATDDEREAYKKNAEQLYGLTARERMLRDAQSVNPLRLEDLDTNTDLFNVLNGTLNLKTSAFNAHNAADLISKKAGAAFAPGTDCPLWKKTLDEIFEGKAEIIRYFQKVLGYALLGKPVEKEFYILFGRETDNGKSTITQTIEKLMGDYALNAPPELIAEKRFKDSSRPSGDRARLAGVRFLSINEPERGLKLDEAYVKAITGRDTQTARHLHQAEFQYAVQFIMFISTNHLPYVSDQTLFKSGRVRVIPFERRFEEHEKNKSLIDQLRRPEELSGILNWVLDGLAAYRQEGLQPPPAVNKEVKDYERNSDNVMRFLEDCTEKDINGAVPTSTLYAAYGMWCADEGLSSMSLKAFSQSLKERGIKIEIKRHNGSAPISHAWGIKCTFSTI